MNLYYTNNSTPMGKRLSKEALDVIDINVAINKIEALNISTPVILQKQENTPLYLISNINNILQSHKIQWSDIDNNTVYFDSEENVYYLDGRQFPDYITNILLEKITDTYVSSIIMNKMKVEISANVLSLENMHKRYNAQLQLLLQTKYVETLQTTRMNHNPDKRMFQAIVINNELKLFPGILFDLFMKSNLYADAIVAYKNITGELDLKRVHYLPEFKPQTIKEALEYITNLNIDVKNIRYTTEYTYNWQQCMKLLQIRPHETFTNNYDLEIGLTANIHSGNFWVVSKEQYVSKLTYAEVETAVLLQQLNHAHTNAIGYFSNFLYGYNVHNKIKAPIVGYKTIAGLLSCVDLIKNNYTTDVDHTRFWQTCETLEFGLGVTLHDTNLLVFTTPAILKILDVLATSANVSKVRCATIIGNLSNIEDRLSSATKNTYGTIITAAFLQKYKCVVTGGVISCLIATKNFVSSDIDLLVLQEHYAAAFTHLSQHADVDATFINERNVLNRRHSFKLKSGFFIDLFCSNLNNVGYMSTIQRFHVSCVRAYWNGKDLVALPSYVHTILHNNIENSRYISTNQSVLSVYKKYQARGFNIKFADKYCEYVFKHV